MKKIFLIFLSILSMNSCKEFLEREPVEEISVNNLFKDKQGALNALNGVYYQIRQDYFSGVSFYFGDLLSGNTTFIPNTSGNFVVWTNLDALYNFEDDSNQSELASFYQSRYEMINSINLILEKIDDVQDASQEEKNQIKAECLALRAFVHFNLLKYYSQSYNYTQDASHLGIVYNTKVLKVGIDFPIRLTNKECTDLLEKDIKDAISLYQNSKKAIPVGEIHNFFNLNAAKTLAAEIALYKNDFEGAIDYSTDVISNSGLTLTTNSDFTIDKWGMSERIWDLAATENNQSPLKNIYNYTSAENRVSISLDVINSMDANDARRKIIAIQNRRTLVNGASVQRPYYFTTKYFRNINALIYRLSELYFIRAEAAFKSGNTSQALTDINVIRNRTGLSTLNSITIDEILAEKRKEFLCENKYYFDLMRNKKDIKRISNCLSSRCNLTYPNDKFVSPIPISTININSRMQQNPGY